MTDGDDRRDAGKDEWWADAHALIDLFGNSSWREMRLRYRGRELTLSKDGIPDKAGAEPSSVPKRDSASPLKKAAAVPKAPEEPLIAEGCIAIRAPNMGTFYRAPKPGAPPFVEAGQNIEPGDELCLIEVMKLFTTLKADMAGTLRRIVPQDGELVQKGSLLFVIEP